MVIFVIELVFVLFISASLDRFDRFSNRILTTAVYLDQGGHHPNLQALLIPAGDALLTLAGHLAACPKTRPAGQRLSTGSCAPEECSAGVTTSGWRGLKLFSFIYNGLNDLPPKCIWSGAGPRHTPQATVRAVGARFLCCIKNFLDSQLHNL